MISPELLSLLRCPETHQKLRVAEAELVQKLNERIQARELQNRAGKKLEATLEAALVREDNAVAYPIRGKLPIMLIDESIQLPVIRPPASQ